MKPYRILLLASLGFSILAAASICRAQSGITDLIVARKVNLQGSTVPTSLTVSVNDYAPGGMSNASFLLISSTGAVNVTGLAGGTQGRLLWVKNVGTFDITLKDESASSTAANRFTLGADVVLAAKSTVSLWYNSTTSRWEGLTSGSGGGGGAVSSVTGTANEITVSPTTGATVVSLPASLTFTGKTVTGGTFASPTIGTPVVSGGTFTSPTFVTPALGTPASGVATNLTGTAAGLTAGTVTTNANLTGDVTSVGNATTLATVNSNVGSFGSSTAIPTLTVNGKGQVTAVSTNAVVAPASTLSGSTLASGVTASSLTSTGVLNSGSIGTGFGAIDVGTDSVAGGFFQINKVAGGSAFAMLSTTSAGAYVTVGTATANVRGYFGNGDAVYTGGLVADLAFSTNALAGGRLAFATLDTLRGVIDANGLTMIGNVNAGASSTIDLSTGALPSLITSTTNLRFGNAVNVANGIQGDGFGTATGFQIYGRTAGGTRASPSATPANQKMIDLLAYGYTSALTTSPAARYRIEAKSLWTGSNAATQHIWSATPTSSTTAADVMTLDSTGLAVTGTFSATSDITASAGRMLSGYNGAAGSLIRNLDDTSSTQFVTFHRADTTVIGSVSRVTTTNAVSYNTTSDGRLKTNLRDFTAEDAGKIIDGLRPRWFDWKASELNESVTTVDAKGEKQTKLVKVTDKDRLAKHAEDNKGIIGFIAQEEAAVGPELIRSGAVTPGDPDPTMITKQWQRSDAALVPVLVAEVKSLRARVATLEGKPIPVVSWLTAFSAGAFAVLLLRMKTSLL